MSMVSQYQAKIEQLKRSQLIFRIEAVTRAYVADSGNLVLQGGSFIPRDALLLALWITEVYGSAEATD